MPPKKKSVVPAREKGFDLSGLTVESPPTYDALGDPALHGHFRSPVIRQQMYEAGFIDRFGRILDVDRNTVKVRIVDQELHHRDVDHAKKLAADAQKQALLDRERFMATRQYFRWHHTHEASLAAVQRSRVSRADPDASFLARRSPQRKAQSAPSAASWTLRDSTTAGSAGVGAAGRRENRRNSPQGSLGPRTSRRSDVGGTGSSRGAGGVETSVGAGGEGMYVSPPPVDRDDHADGDGGGSYIGSAVGSSPSHLGAPVKLPPLGRDGGRGSVIAPDEGGARR
eukprot:TRINITY_DN10737_c0_g1_i1.p1 TRINITY_DN10737_c0_g1~~TRINITY_DN10737_c0_g1_i1.p1  ORF type:complete len:283 (+),score=26.49 TRINITY_DN10737_c0_g1_i1:141-989(+)